MRNISLLILLMAYNITALCQAGKEEERAEILQMKNDTAKVNRIISLARKLQNTDLAQTKDLLRLSLSLAGELKYTEGKASAYILLATVNVNQMQLDSSKYFNDLAISSIDGLKGVPAKNLLGAINNIYGIIYQQRQAYDSAAIKYLSALEIFTETSNYDRIYYSTHNLSTLYTYLEDSVRARNYAQQAYKASRMSGDSGLLLKGYISMLNVYFSFNEYDSLYHYSSKGLELATRREDLFSKGKFLQGMGVYFLESKKDYPQSISYLQQSLGIFDAEKYPYDRTISLHYLGLAYLELKEYATSKQYLFQAIEKEREYELNQMMVHSLGSLVRAEEGAGNISAAFRHQQELIEVKDSLQAGENRKNVEEIEARYQASLKDQQIKLQQASIRQKDTLNYVLIGGSAGLLVISFLLYRNHKNKQNLQQQRIAELETEKKLAATESVLQGEEQERTRLARDLHDGLGGMLSGIKYSLNTMKGNLTMTQENAQAFERSIDMLDSSIKEMRRVAHNMMPEALVKFGLDTALRDFCNDLNQSGAIKVSYQSIGLENSSISQVTSITIYRIIQELLSNVIRHAGATSAIVQVTFSGETISITVEDDGKGFDTRILKGTTGIGWNNIISRIEYLNGKQDVQSAKDKGTSVFIELKA